MVFVALDHVQLALPPKGEDAARRFYAEGLGMTERPKPTNLARRGGCWFESGPVRIHLGVEAEFRPARKAHPAIEIEIDDLDGLIARLSTLDYPSRTDEPLVSRRRVYVDDPFGNRIELMQRT